MAIEAVSPGLLFGEIVSAPGGDFEFTTIVALQ
jgi:hypothetical protein